ncbi:MAG: hypothetical protein QM762_30285 [Chryseolinea sp.]
MTLQSLRTLSLVVVLSCCFITAHGQTSAVPSNLRSSFTLESLGDATQVSQNEVLYGVPAPAGKIIGDTYLSKSWRKSAIQLYKDERVIKGYPVRYDIYTDALDVKTDNGVKVLEGKRIQSFSWLDSTRADPVFFVNARDYKLENIPLTGFLEVLVDGSAPLFKRTELHVKKADYNVAFDVGSRDDKILKDETYFVGQDKNVIELSAAKKKVLSIFRNKTAEMEKYIDENNLSLKKEADLVKIFGHYNALLTQ